MSGSNTQTTIALSLALLSAPVSIFSLYQVGTLKNAPDYSVEIEAAKREMSAKHDALVNSFESRVEQSIEAIVDRRKEKAPKAAVEPERTRDVSGAATSMTDDGDPVYGNPDAKYTVISFEDFRCGYCERYHPTIKQFVDDSDGAVNWVLKPYPILGPASVQLAAAAECVATTDSPAAFWTYTENAYATKNWRMAVEQTQVADAQAVISCVEENEMQFELDSILIEGEKLGITGTPASIFRNNETENGAFASGFLQPHQMRQMLNEVSGE